MRWSLQDKFFWSWSPLPLLPRLSQRLEAAVATPEAGGTSVIVVVKFQATDDPDSARDRTAGIVAALIASEEIDSGFVTVDPTIVAVLDSLCGFDD